MSNAVTERVWASQRQKQQVFCSQIELFKSYKLDKSTRTRNKIVTLNDGLARDIAHRAAGVCAVPYDDLLQWARIGLIKAVEKFDPGKGHAFSSFAVPYVRGEILHFLRDHDWDGVGVPRRAIEANSKVRQVGRIWQRRGRDVPLEKVAASLGIDATKWREISELTARKPQVDLDAAVGVAAACDEERIAHQQLRQQVARMPRRLGACIVGHYFKGLSEEAIAAQSGATVEEVHLCLKQGLDWLKKQNEERLA